MSKPLPTLSRSLCLGLCLSFSTISLGFAGDIHLDQKDQTSLNLALYMDGIAQIREKYSLNIKQGAQRLITGKLPQTILPNSLTMTLSSSGNIIGNDGLFEPWVSPAEGLLKSHLNQNILWRRAEDKTLEKARIISIEGGLLVAFDQGVEFNPMGQPVFPKLKNGAFPLSHSAYPRYSRQVNANQRSKANIDLDYQAAGFQWQAVYDLFIDQNERAGQFTGKALLTNNSDRDWINASVNLIAGSIPRQSRGPRMQKRQMLSAAPMARAMSADMVESAPAPMARASHDLQIYVLGDPITLKADSISERRLIDKADITLRKRYVMNHQNHNSIWRRGTNRRGNPSILIDFRNRSEDGLGKPLPAGLVRVYGKLNETGDAPFLLGEVNIPNRPVGEKIKLPLGAAFDITTDRKQTHYKRLDNKGRYEAGYEITFKNAKDSAVVVELNERFQGTWRITSQSHKHVKKDAFNAVWTISIPANGETVFAYQYNQKP
jgi:hypothetical protein